jgi:hypothetical protein
MSLLSPVSFASLTFRSTRPWRAEKLKSPPIPQTGSLAPSNLVSAGITDPATAEQPSLTE